MFLSVVIPTYNRLPILRQCLQALELQSQEPPLEGYEVVVVDDGSTDATVAWLEGAIAA
ncbi:MAG: glycosyltransferase family 2 protein, partial [Cyanobium sp.]